MFRITVDESLLPDSILIITDNLILITMKSNIKALVILITLLVSSVIFTKQASAQEPNVSFQVFYDQLSPYGQWVNYPNYGYVWIPDAGSDFSPYSSGGHWIMTDYGWTWVSDYSWGWAPFHYGRWDYDNSYGWLWVPGNEWGPAWVTWRRSNGYYGWEPMQPGISISASFGREYNRNKDHWTFVGDRYFDSPDVSRYYVNQTSRDRIITNSSVINNTYVDNRRNATYVSGPKREDVQRFTGRKVNPVAVQENNTPGQNMSNGRLNIYRPQVLKNNNTGMKPVPSKVVDLKDVKRPSERNATNKSQTVTQPQTVNRPQTVNKPQTVTQPQKVNRSQTVNKPQTVNQPQKVNRPQTVNKPQTVTQPQKVNRPQTVNKPQTVTQPQKVNRPQTVNKPQTVTQPQTVNRPQAVNKPQTVNQPQTVNRSQTNTKNLQKSNNDSKVVEQRNANPSQNRKSEKQPVTVKPPVRNNNEQQQESHTEQDKKKPD